MKINYVKPVLLPWNPFKFILLPSVFYYVLLLVLIKMFDTPLAGNINCVADKTKQSTFVKLNCRMRILFYVKTISKFTITLNNVKRITSKLALSLCEFSQAILLFIYLSLYLTNAQRYDILYPVSVSEQIDTRYNSLLHSIYLCYTISVWQSLSTVTNIMAKGVRETVEWYGFERSTKLEKFLASSRAYWNSNDMRWPPRCWLHDTEMKATPLNTSPLRNNELAVQARLHAIISPAGKRSNKQILNLPRWKFIVILLSRDL